MNHHSPTISNRSRVAAGFTLVEVIVVLVIIGLLATMSLRPLMNTEKRQFDLLVENVADLMLVYAQRDQLHGVRTGIFCDAARKELSLVTFQQPDNELARGQWERDPYNRPVKLPEFMQIGQDVYAIEAGSYYDFTMWPLTKDVGQRRPEISITLIWGDMQRSIELPSHAIAPRASGGRMPSERKAVDLDRMGRDREEW